VVKTPLPNEKGEPPSFEHIMMESGMIKLIANPEYIAEISEEIIVKKTGSDEVTNYIVIIEQAINDFDKILKIWKTGFDEKKDENNKAEFN
jgi:hypothetical protein